MLIFNRYKTEHTTPEKGALFLKMSNEKTDILRRTSKQQSVSNFADQIYPFALKKKHFRQSGMKANQECRNES